MKIGKFISLVKEHPVLYDSLNPLYKDRKEKDKLWREISTVMNIHSDIAKSRWKSLKDCYTKYLKSTIATGPAVYLKYINWQWAEQMEFMKLHIKFGLIISNIELKEHQETDDLETQSSSDVQVYQSSSGVPDTHDRFVTHERSESPDKSNTQDRTEVLEKSITKIRPKMLSRSRIYERTFDKIRTRRTEMVSPDANTSLNNDGIVHCLETKKINSYSATELIFLGFSKSIKTLPIKRQAQVKMKIAKIMMEEEIANFEETVSLSDRSE